MRKLRWASAACVIVALLCFGSALAEENTELVTVPVSVYESNDGIRIISYTDTWADDGLKRVYEELKNNMHGVDMEYLDRIEIHQGPGPDSGPSVSATYEKEAHVVRLPVNLEGFLPAGYELPVSLDKGVIKLYNGDTRAALEDLAVDISHEYGHHFTLFHFGDKFKSPEKFRDSGYYKARGLDAFSQVNADASYVEEIHRWGIYEIAAEDYRQLLGSATGRSITAFSDIQQKSGQDVYNPVNSISRRDYNALPQENWELPTAFEVSGLSDYFRSFLNDVVAAGHLEEYRVPGLVYHREKIYGFDRVVFSWLPQEGPEGAVYTLVAYSEDAGLIPIKTVFPGDEPVAVVGTAALEKNAYVYYYQ
ncbi:MAG TPA: hypothetical protein PKO35_07790, partial [Candidatus Atribacteria bacterium]|nr:hypothetical protein [Candidatus Atribacteria bacterium]